MIAREEREYGKADGIVVLSSFARQSFIDCGAPEAKLFLLPLGVEVERFRPKAEIVIERCRRIRSGDPLHILFVGALSFRKGLLDYSEIVADLAGPAFQFRFIGSIPPESRQAAKPLAERSELIGRQPESELPKWYEWADVFLFPTIEDGFAVVLGQALAAALPVLTTSHCSGPDIVRENESGWVLPIRQPGRSSRAFAGATPIARPWPAWSSVFIPTFNPVAGTEPPPRLKLSATPPEH